MAFKYLNENCSAEIIVNKSTFIAYLYCVSTKQDVKNILEHLKQQHPKANHYCYGYLLDNNRTQKYSDDSEPAKTAGFPILDVLKKNNIDECLAVVVRYFGGIKLGAGGLTRAYRSAITNVLSKTILVEKIEVPVYHLTVDYHINDETKDFLDKNCILLNTTYNENVVYEFYCFNESIPKKISDLTKGQKASIVKYIKVVNP